MIGNWPLLTIVTFLPMIGVAFLMMIRGEEELVAQNARNVALWVSSFTLVISLALVLNFDPQAAGYQFEERAEWLPGAGISYHLGVFHHSLDTADSAGDPGELEGDHASGARVHDRLSRSGDDDDRHVRLA